MSKQKTLRDDSLAVNFSSFLQASDENQVRELTRKIEPQRKSTFINDKM